MHKSTALAVNNLDTYWMSLILGHLEIWPVALQKHKTKHSKHLEGKVRSAFARLSMEKIRCRYLFAMWVTPLRVEV